jgi:hypothetical protein
MSPLLFGLRSFWNILCFCNFKWAPYFLDFVHSRMFYASAISNEPLAFWTSFLPECFMLPWFQMSPLLFALRPDRNTLCFHDFKWAPYFLGFVPFGMFYASTISNEPLAFGLRPFWNDLRFCDFDLWSQWGIDELDEPVTLQCGHFEHFFGGKSKLIFMLWVRRAPPH